MRRVGWRGTPSPDTGDAPTTITSVEEHDGGAVVLENGAVLEIHFTGPQRFLVLEIKPHCQRG